MTSLLWRGSPTYIDEDDLEVDGCDAGDSEHGECASDDKQPAPPWARFME